MSEDFKIWWHREGSGMPPLNGEEACEHVERVSAIAWSNGAYKATEALKAENARLKAEAERYRLASLRVDVGELHSQFNKALFDETVAQNARLKTEVEHLMVFCNCTLIPNKELQAKVERLTKAGDAFVLLLKDEGYDMESIREVEAWNAAKEGKPRA